VALAATYAFNVEIHTRGEVVDEAHSEIGAKIAMTAAALIISGAALITTANAETFKGRCFGVNGCAGKGACKSASNDCKGKNSCKGKGWLEMLNTECTDQGGTFEKS
jgi:hypothetical protein